VVRFRSISCSANRERLAQPKKRQNSDDDDDQADDVDEVVHEIPVRGLSIKPLLYG
jgi:hypothetical protein